MSTGAIYLAFVILVGALFGYSACIVAGVLDVAYNTVFSPARPLGDTAGGGVVSFLFYEAAAPERAGILLLTASVEELLFRQFGFMFLRSRGLSTLACISLSSLAFGLTHWPSGLGAVLLTTTVGLLLGTLYAYRGDRIDLPILVHFTYNMSIFSLLADGDNSGSAIESQIWPWWHYLLALGSACLATLALLREEPLRNKMRSLTGG